MPSILHGGGHHSSGHSSGHSGGHHSASHPAPSHPSRSRINDDALSTTSTGIDAADTDSIGPFDLGDESIGGRDPLEEAFTPAWAERVLEVVEACPKPVLLYDRTAAAAIVVSLIRSAKMRQAGPVQVGKWAKSLGADLELHTDLANVVERLLDI
jgi:hypothetical protein